MRIAVTATIILPLLGMWGCDGSAPSPPPQVDATSIAAPPPPEPETAPQPAPEAGSAPAAVPAAEGGTSEKAAVGVGAKGRDYGGPGFVTTPIETLFRIEDRVVFEAQIPNNMKIYKAEHNNKGPKDQDEFMQVIIKDGGVTLPELPAGDVYWYDPKTEELLVRHPKQ